jgi:ribonuclease P protein component
MDTEVGKEHLIISVPKKIYKRAVKRNLIRRRIREAFRLNCKDLPNIQGKDLLLVYVSSHIMDYGKITETLISAISKVGVDS